MEALRPGRVKPSRVKRMKELSAIEKEARQLHAEFEDYKRARRRLAKRARKLANNVRRRYPDMRISGNDDFGLHTVVEDIAVDLHLDHREDDYNYNDPAHRVTSSFNSLFSFLKKLSDVPWLKPQG